MSLNVPVLRRSFNLVAPSAERLSQRFYDRLFQNYPQVQPLFADLEMPAQRKKLIASLIMVVENLENPQKLTHYLQQLGIRHVDYGTEPGHYDAVGENLLAVLGEIAGDAWTDEVRDAWADAYGVIAKIMIEAAWPSAATATATATSERGATTK
jgi:hemoglobin-like flavoprotein